MKGNNEIRWCHAEMIRAVEYYLNEVQLKEPVSVVGVSEKQMNMNTGFVINIHEYVPTEKESDV